MMGKVKAPSFQFYPKDWLEFKVLRMSDAAQGVYMRLLCHIWIGTETQYKIKNNDKFLARCLGISVLKWKKYKTEIQHADASLFIEDNGYLVSKRLKEEREKQEERRLQTQEASHKRWYGNNMQTDNQTDMRTDMRKASPSSSTSSSTSSSKNNIYVLIDFWQELAVSGGQLIRHQNIEKAKRNSKLCSSIQQRLEEYSLDDIKQAYSNYNKFMCLPPERKRWLGYRWNQYEFMSRGKDNVSRFKDWDTVEYNFCQADSTKKGDWTDRIGVR